MLCGAKLDTPAGPVTFSGRATEQLALVVTYGVAVLLHAYGFLAVFAAGIASAVANGPVSSFRGHGMHWGVPKGAGNSQSLPAMRPLEERGRCCGL